MLEALAHECRRLHATTADPKRPEGDLRPTDRQDSIDAAVMP